MILSKAKSVFLSFVLLLTVSHISAQTYVNSGSALQTAITGATNTTRTIILQNDVELPNNVNVPTGAKITITSAPGNKFIISLPNTAGVTRHITVPSTATGVELTFKNVIIEGRNSSTVKRGGISVNSPSGSNNKLTLENTTVRNCNYNIASTDGGGISVQKGDLILIGDIVISDNTSTRNGGGIYYTSTYPSSFNTSGISSLLVANNGANGSGGGIYSDYPLSLNIGTFIGNTSSGTGITSPPDGGGAIYALKLFAGRDLTFTNNTARLGGGVYSHVSFTGRNLNFTTNTATSGGGIYANDPDTEISGSVFNGNTVTSSGGGLNARNSVTATDVIFLNNKSGQSGGGMVCGVAGVATLSRCTFEGNEITNTGASNSIGGGGLIIAGSPATVTNCTFYKNRCNISGATSTDNGGGAITVWGTTAVSIRFSTFNGNSAATGAQAINFANATGKSMYGNIVYGNQNTANTDPEIRVNNANFAFSTIANTSYNIVKGITSNGTNQGVAAGNAGNIFATIVNSTTDLALLDNNGGFTKTIDIKRGGLAHDKIPTGLSWLEPVDQRGEKRPYQAGTGNVLDIGSVELDFSEINICANIRFAFSSLHESTEPGATLQFYDSGLTPIPITKTDTVIKVPGKYTFYVEELCPTCAGGLKTIFLNVGNCTTLHHQAGICWPGNTIDVLSNIGAVHGTTFTDLTITSGPNLPGATAVVLDNKIVYSYDSMGSDKIEYSFNCDGTTVTGELFISMVECPDNIHPVACYDDIVSFDWTIAEAWKSKETDVVTYCAPIAGDLDGDGIPEIVVVKVTSENPSGENYSSFRSYKNIYVYPGNNRSNPIEIPTPLGNYLPAGAIAMARVPIGGGMVPLVLMIDFEGYIRAYNPFKPGGVSNMNDFQWKSDVLVVQPYDRTIVFAAIAFADFNNDGIPEVYAGNRIFNAATGKMLVDGSVTIARKAATQAFGLQNHPFQYFPAVADIDGDGELEYVAGLHVYKVNITNLSGSSGNSFTPLTQMSPITVDGKTITEGMTILADFNHDGKLDVVVVSHADITTDIIAVWEIETLNILGTLSQNTNNFFGGIPFIGDVDNDGELEILFTSATSASRGWLNGFRLSGNSFSKVYHMSVTDLSSATGITLFDFTQSGTANLVYRDEENLMIMEANPVQGGVGGFDILAKFTNTSGTFFEYPIVLDVDNDGYAEIVVVGNNFGAGEINYGYVSIFKSGSTDNPWAPARKVWNQYPYNPAFINEDLTVPQYQMNHARLFAGKDEMMGTADDVQPFNNFLHQQTTLNQYGIPYWAMPNIAWHPAGTLPTCVIDGDSAVYSGCIKNIGEAVLSSPIYVTFYKDNIEEANILKTITINESLPKGGIYCFTDVVLKDLSSYGKMSSLWISINDNGIDYPHHTDCEPYARHEIVISCPRPVVTQKNQCR